MIKSQFSVGNQQRSVLNMSDKAESEQHQPVELPLTADPLIASGNPTQPTPRRHLGDGFDPRLTIGWSNFVTTTDSLFIFACGYPDYSFRVIDSDSGGGAMLKVTKFMMTIFQRKCVKWCTATGTL